MKFYFLITFAFFLATCKKEKATVGNTVAFDTSVRCPQSIDSLYLFPPFMGGIPENYFPSSSHLMNDTLWKYPCFNPNNSSEISYIQQVINGSTSLIKYDLIKGTKTILRENLVTWTQPVWCMNNWSYIEGDTGNIERINMNTGELQQLTTSHRDGKLTSNILTGEFIFMHGESPNLEYKKSNSDGGVIENYFTHPDGDWRPGIIAGTQERSTVSFSPDDHNNFSLLKDFGARHSILDLKIHPNNKDIYFTFWYWDGMYKADIESKSITVVKEGNNSCWYDSFSISQDGEQIIFEKVVCDFGWGTGLNSVFSKREIWIMDIDGCHERKVNL